MSASMFPYYVPLRMFDAPKGKIGKNEKYPLVVPIIQKGLQVTENIIPNLQKMGFVNHDLHKFLELAMHRYMTIV